MTTVELRPQNENLLIWCLGWLWPQMRDEWVSYGNTMWYPCGVDPYHPSYAWRREHEGVCLQWCRRMGTFWYCLCYLLVPPVRWRIKRDAYLRVNIRRYGYLPEMATEFALAEALGAPARARTMLIWFRRQEGR